MDAHLEVVREAVAHKKSNRQLTDACRANFLSHLRLSEWRDVHSQLLTVVREHEWRINESDATFEQVHLSLLTSLLGNGGLKADDEPLVCAHHYQDRAGVARNGRRVSAEEIDVGRALGEEGRAGRRL